MGPKAKPSRYLCNGQHETFASSLTKDDTNTETTNVAVISEDELKSCITRGTPGAKNDDPRGVRRVRADRTPMFSLSIYQHLNGSGLLREFSIPLLLRRPV